MDGFWQRLETASAEFTGRLAGAVLVLVVGWLALRFLLAPLRRWLERGRLDPSMVSFLAGTVRTLLVVAIALALLGTLGVQTASLLTLLGAAGLAVALSLQGSLANFAAGLVVLSFRLVRVGDLVEVGDVRGRVRELLPFHAVLETEDRVRVTLPNTLLAGGVVRNHTALGVRRARWTLPLAAGIDLGQARGALRARLLADPRVLREPAPEVFVQEWAADRRVLAVSAWTGADDNAAVQQELLEALGETLERLHH
jgi:small conductance mechanosensitive channel